MPVKRRTLIAAALTLVLVSAVALYAVKFRSAQALTMRAQPEQSVFTSKGVSARLVKIILDYDKVETNDQTAEITARVSLPFDFNRSMNFKWKFGEGVQLVDGANEGVLQGLRAGEEMDIRIKVKGFSSQENHQVGFEINGARNGQYIYGDALIASDLENTFENTVQNVERIKASQ